MKNISKILQRCELFKTLTPEALEAVAAHAALLDVKAGEPITVEGKPSGALFVIAAGAADYIKRMDAKSGLILGKWGEGDVIGVDEVFDGKEYFVSAVASGPVKCVRIAAEDFKALCAADALFEHRVLTQALIIQSGRLRQITRALREFLAKILK